MGWLALLLRILDRSIEGLIRGGHHKLFGHLVIVTTGATVIVVGSGVGSNGLEGKALAYGGIALFGGGIAIGLAHEIRNFVQEWYGMLKIERYHRMKLEELAIRKNAQVSELIEEAISDLLVKYQYLGKMPFEP
jgi:hypothetical protein